MMRPPSYLLCCNATRHTLRHCHTHAKPPPDTSTTHFGFSTIPTSEKQQRVSSVFTSVAQSYDIMNDLMSGGMHRAWKRAFVSELSPTADMTILDCAAGTGDIGRLILERAPGASVVLSDPNPDMLKRAAHRGPSGLQIVAADAQYLPFTSASFDAYTISFGMRNVPRPELALKEAFRVLKPRGRFLMLEFADVGNPVLKSLYDAYSFNVIPRIGSVVARDRPSYQYLVESIRAFPKQAQFAQMMKDAGFRYVSVTDYSFGIAACYSAFKPPESP